MARNGFNGFGLAQYRELEAFSQFASDLDKSTRDQLARGERLVEVLKQPQYSPLSGAQQYTILYAANEGVLDSLEVGRISAFKEQWFTFLSAELPELESSLNEGNKPSAEALDKLKATLITFRDKQFR